MADANLDEQFGPLLQPSNVKLHEGSQSLSASYELDDSSADVLDLVMELSEQKARLFDFLLQRLAILWIVTETGKIRFCLEEMCAAATPAVRYPRIRRMPSHPSLTPLGHPALVGGRAARIAGEITLDVDDEGRPQWMLTNRSGRYGIHPSRRPEHLENVARRFGDYDILLRVQYIRPFALG